MTSAKLGEICTIVSGGTPSRSKSEYWINGTIPWIKIGNIKGKYVVNADENITELGLEKSSAKFLKKGTILYTIFATLGEVGILNIDACTNQAIAGITIKDTTIIGTDFLYYYLKSKKQYVDRIGRGVAQNNINMSILRNFDVPLLSLEKQKDIVSTLDTLQSIITHRRTQLEKLDLLVKARFVEMFGDIYTNKYNLPICQLSDYITFLTSGSRGWAKYCTENGADWFITIKNVKACKITTHNIQRLNAPDNMEAKRTKVQEDDLLISITADLGRTGVITKEIAEHGAYINQHLTCIRLNKSKITPIYAAYFMESNSGRPQFEAKNQAGVKAGLNFDSIKSLKMLVPPLNLQTQFADFVKQVDKSKVAVQKALDEAQLLFDSLMQEYFG